MSDAASTPVDVVRARSLALAVLAAVLALDSGEPDTGEDYSRAIALAYSLGRMWDGGGAGLEARKTWSLCLVDLLQDELPSVQSADLWAAVGAYQSFLGVPPEGCADYGATGGDHA